jgi:protein TonB
LFEAVQPSAPAPIKSAGSAPASTGAASAPAPAREIAVPVEAKLAAAPPVEHKELSVPTFGATIGSSPSFGALDDRDAEESGGSKKLMIIAAVVIVAAALGFFGWTKVSNSSSQAPSVATHEAPVSTASPTPKNVAPSAPVSAPAASAGQPAAPTSSKPSANVGTSSIAITPEPEVVTKKIAPAIVVKSPARVQQQSEDSAPQVPNPLAVAAPNDKKLSSLVSSVPASAPTPTLATVKISQGVSQGLLIKRVQPRYPQNALAMRIQGAVQMEATINKEGNIINLRVASGDAVLSRAAVEAVKQWRYKPYYLNGEPVEIETQITVNFKLPN